MKLILLLLLHFHLIISQITQYFEALNSSCIQQQYIIAPSKSATKKFIKMKIPALSQAIIQIDLRHLASVSQIDRVLLSLDIQNTLTNEVYNQFLQCSVSTTQYILFAANQVIISAYFRISDTSNQTILSKSYLFSQSVSVKVVPANPEKQSQQKSFFFVVTSSDQISLPYNMISRQDANNFRGYFLTEDSPLSNLRSRQTSILSYSDYWNGLQSVTLPYVPYTSNCENKGDYLFFSQLIHNQSYCKLYGKNIVPIDQFSFGSTATADTCNFTTKCVYDQIKDTSNQYSFWNTINTVDTVLFSITAIQSSSIDILNNYDSTDLVPCKLKTTSGTGSADKFPLKISINLGYYQKTETERRMINCQVQYSLYSQSRENFTYQLNINLSPLSHTSILLNFGFDWYIYMIVFILIGLVSNFQFLIFWCYHLIVTIKSKRTVNLKMYLRLQKQILKGVIPAGFITLFFTFVIQIIMNGTFFGKPIFSEIRLSFWDFILAYDFGNSASTYKANSQSGRMGFSYLVVASCMMIYLSGYLIGKQRKKSQYQQYEIMGRKFKPKTWKRGKLLFSSLTYIFMCVYFLYFTYAPVFNNNIWLIIAFMQIFQMVLEEVIYSIFDDQLPCLPLKLTVGVMAYLGTMGAIDLYYFILGYLVDVGISIIQITYLSQLQQGITNFIERKIQEFNKFYYNLLNDEDEDQDDKSHAGDTQVQNDSIAIEKNQQEIDFLQKEIEEEHNLISFEEIRIYDNEMEIGKKYFEFISQNREKYQKKQSKDSKQKSSYLKKQQEQEEKKEFYNKKFQLIVDGSCGMIQYLIQPIIVLFLWITYQTSTILNNFQISSQNCILYLLSSLILAFFFQINIIIIFHVLQLYLNTDYRKLIIQLLDRFKDKKTFWITDLDQINNDLEIKLRGLFSYSISSQMFFVVTLYTLSMYFFIVGCTTIIQSKYNIFKDPYIILIFIFWILFFKISENLLKKIAKLLNIWGYSDFSRQKQSQTRIEQFSSFDNQTNEIMRREQMFNHSSIKFTFKHLQKQFIQQPDEEVELQKKSILRSKLITICKKLQPQFDKEEFKIEYARKNKDFIRKNIEKILPLVTSFPVDDAAWIGKANTKDDKDIKKQNKNCDPLISDFISQWIKRVENDRAKRQEDGVERERRLKKCHFCFNTWNIYYGFDGICLECSQKLGKQKEKKQ